MGHYLSSPNKEKSFDEGEYEKMKYVACGMQGWRVSMEDAHIAKFNIAPDTHIFGIFDGHGGHEVSKYVSNHFIDTLLKNEKFRSGDYGGALIETFLAMDDLLETPEARKELTAIQLCQSPDKIEEEEATDTFAGCTSCVALLVKDKMYVANAGDSRCYITSKGDVIPLTKDHKPTDKPELERIEKAGGEVVGGRVNGRLNLSRGLGDLDYKDNENLEPHEQMMSAMPDIKVWDLSKDDEFLILGCDGIWECRPANKICEFIKSSTKGGKSLKHSIEDLLDDIVATDLDNGAGTDNMTCIVVSLK